MGAIVGKSRTPQVEEERQEKMRSDEDLEYALELYGKIGLASKNALRHLEVFADDFCEEFFNVDFHSHHMEWIEMR